MRSVRIYSFFCLFVSEKLVLESCQDREKVLGFGRGIIYDLVYSFICRILSNFFLIFKQFVLLNYKASNFFYVLSKEGR